MDVQYQLSPLQESFNLILYLWISDFYVFILIVLSVNYND